MAIKKYLYNDKLTPEENNLLDRLYSFKTSQMAEALEQQFLDPNSDLEDFHTRISKIINCEWEQRYQTKINKLVAKSTLKYPDADFDESIYDPDRILDVHALEQLQTCSWIDDHRNLLITGSAGAGKTHFANAFCIAAIQQLKSTKYIRANTLIQECQRAEQNGKILDYYNAMADFELLVIDDFGMMELDIEKCRHIFEIMESRDTRKSTIIASQLPVDKWWDLFKDNTYADAILSRMTKQAYRLECKGRDMRQKVIK